MEDQIIKEGDTIIFGDVLGDRQSIISLRGQARVKMGKVYYPAAPIIGCNYGTLFTISADGKSIEKIKHTPSEEWNADVEVTRNNAKLQDANKINQSLQHEEILAMKQAGVGGQKIIDALLTSSATFEAKNEFSQEKYKKRKAKKYVQLACVKRPTAASICETLFSKQSSRIGYLRIDALGILLHMANVGPGSNILVLENSGGLVAGAVAERMGGYGTVCATYLEPHPKSIELVRSFNFTPEIMETVTRAPLLGLLKMRKKQLEKENNNVETDGTMETIEPILDPPVAEEPAIAEPEKEEADQTNPPPMSDGAIGAISSKATIVNPPFSGCIICNPTLQPKTALNALLPLLAPSACFAVWSQYLDPLVDAMNTLRSTGSAVNLMVQETWYRKQQVLPKRTHPLMNMNHGGGYMLSGTVTVTGAAMPIAI